MFVRIVAYWVVVPVRIIASVSVSIPVQRIIRVSGIRLSGWENWVI